MVFQKDLDSSKISYLKFKDLLNTINSLLTETDILVVSNSALALYSNNFLAIEENIVLLLESFIVLNIQRWAYEFKN